MALLCYRGPMNRAAKIAAILPPSLAPRGLNREQAAAYIGISTTLFDVMVADGRMPEPKKINSRTLWDRHALDSAFDALPDRAPWNPWNGPEQAGNANENTHAGRKRNA